MLIAHLTFSVEPQNRDAALSELIAQTEQVRAMHGCVAFVPFADPNSDSNLGITHEWETEADFTAYCGSSCFAKLGVSLRPLLTKPPVSKRFDATLLETVN